MIISLRTCFALLECIGEGEALLDIICDHIFLLRLRHVIYLSIFLYLFLFLHGKVKGCSIVGPRGSKKCGNW
jgi:hypothetical protein